MAHARVAQSLKFRLALLGLLTVAAASAALAGSDRARAWDAGHNGSANLLAYSYDYGVPGSFWWNLNSSIYYVIVTDGGGTYDRIDALTHQVKTQIDWSNPWYGGYFSGDPRTTFYSDGYYVASLVHLNSSCVIPSWNYWWCDAQADYGSGIRIYGAGSAHAEGNLVFGGGGGWYSYSGTYQHGWYYF